MIWEHWLRCWVWKWWAWARLFKLYMQLYLHWGWCSDHMRKSSPRGILTMWSSSGFTYGSSKRGLNPGEQKLLPQVASCSFLPDWPGACAMCSALLCPGHLGSSWMLGSECAWRGDAEEKLLGGNKEDFNLKMSKETERFTGSNWTFSSLNNFVVLNRQPECSF